MKLEIDRKIYSDGCISKAIYSLAKDYAIERLLNGSVETLTISPINTNETEDRIKEKFLSYLNDYKLRQIIADETRDIRTILYAKAFGDFDDLDNERI